MPKLETCWSKHCIVRRPKYKVQNKPCECIPEVARGLRMPGGRLHDWVLNTYLAETFGQLKYRPACGAFGSVDIKELKAFKWYGAGLCKNCREKRAECQPSPRSKNPRVPSDGTG